jgi:predicted MPP superfamily phosphohydrolase
MSRGYILIPFFIVIALSILFFSHYFIYFSIVHFFDVTARGRKVALAILLFMLPASFIASSILAHWSQELILRVFYFGSGLWLGVGLTLIVSFALAWLVEGIAKFFLHWSNPARLGFAAVALACLYSAYGVWNAYHPNTEHVTVRIKNLPSAWQGRRAVQVSDVHLGLVLGPSFFNGIVERINSENPAIVFITGDLFDGIDGRLDELVAPLNLIRAPLGIYYVTGNHETYLGTHRAYEALKKTRARILADEWVAIEGLQVIGVSYPERGFSKDPAEVAKRLPGFDPRLPSVLLYHNPTQIERAMAAGINLQLSGHTHHGQLFPIQFISRLIYGKYYSGLHVQGGYTLYTTSGVGTWGPTMRTGNHPEITVIHFE